MDLAKWMNLDTTPNSKRLKTEKGRRNHLFESIYELISGLSFLHHELDGEITSHHDLKPTNILIYHNTCKMKIADLEFSHLRNPKDGSETGRTSRLGTYEYQPPECYNTNGTYSLRLHGRSFDCWSMGCIIIEICTLIAYGWESKKVAEFTKLRRENCDLANKLINEKEEDRSFHNNIVAVKKWVLDMRFKETNTKFNSILDMMSLEPDARCPLWEVEIAIWSIQNPDDSHQDAKSEKNKLLAREPPGRPKNCGAETPLHRAAKMETKIECYFYATLAGLYMPRTQRVASGLKLLSAIEEDNEDEFDRLLSSGEVDPIVCDNGGQPAICLAASLPNPLIVIRLLQSNASLLLRRESHFKSPLLTAVINKNPYNFCQILKKNPDLDHPDSYGLTPLFYAVEDSNSPILAMLLQERNQVFVQDTYGNTPLHFRVLPLRMDKICSLSPKTLKMLLKAEDAEKCLQHRNKTGSTPLWSVVSGGYLELTEILLDTSSINHTLEKVDGTTVAHRIVQYGWITLLENYLNRFPPGVLKIPNLDRRSPRDLAVHLAIQDPSKKVYFEICKILDQVKLEEVN
ncbi:MAG: hypothetical protein M1829_000415 [Trizodia sp. TS-e1964]|nr:MAG: hypothetical protein M1829_000415 [Trizodia sp. TS-e1964]